MTPDQLGSAADPKPEAVNRGEPASSPAGAVADPKPEVASPQSGTVADPKPELAVNRGGRTVADSVNGFVTHAATGFAGGARLDIATAFFNAGGYSLLADSLDRLTGARLLLGAEPAPPENRRRVLGVESARPERAARVRLNQALESHERDLAEDRDLLGFTTETDAAARRLVGWLRSGRVEVRRLEGRFLHGKAFLVGAHDHGVVAGSSNFTRAGLSANAELNLGNYSPHTVGQVREWFDELWDEAAPYDLAALFEARFEPHPPQLVYLRMLWERYGAELDAEAEAEGAPQIHLTSFQSDGLWRAKRILARHNGVLVADEVGLGKTFLAGALIHEAAIDRRQRVLVIAPATLRDGLWRAFRSERNLPMEVVSYEELMADNRLNPHHAAAPRLEARRIDDYAMVVIDEAHNLRNPATQRAEALRRLLAGSPPKKLVLLTATPVNNSLWDLYHQLGYFLRNDAAFADAGIPSLRDHFARAMALNPDDLTPEHLFDVLDAVAVRRTRSFVKRYYPNDTVRVGGSEQTITFPTPRVLKVTYDLDAVLPGFFDRIARALDPEAAETDPDAAGILALARYAPSMYRLDQPPESYEMQLAGLLLSGLLKRFESSPHAFAETCRRMADSHDAFLALLDQGRVATGDALADWIATDSEDVEEVDAYLDAHLGLTEAAAGYDTDRLRRHVARDRDLLVAFADTAGAVTRAQDPTLAELTRQLGDIAEEAAATGIGAEDVRNRRKVLIFSYFTDTVEWIYGHLAEAVGADGRLAPYRGRVASLTGSDESPGKEAVVWGFAPRTADAPEGSDDDLYDIVVTTDVLAEGVNLQQARHIVNYDLPWNPMRLVQRHGRIDRIGSPHSEVFVRCVFPDARLDDLLNLEEQLHRKIKQAAASVGVGEVLPEQRGRDLTFAETREEIERLRREEAGLLERGGTARGALSGEEYRQELRQAVEQGWREQIERLPWGSGSGMAARAGARSDDGGRPGYVFCARVADSDRALFRYVEPGGSGDGTGSDGPGSTSGGHHREAVAVAGGSEDEGGSGPTVVADTLACLDRARPPDGFDTPRALDDDAYRLAFDAWAIARADIVKRWNHLADKANLEPRVPPALVRAAEILRAHPPADLTQDEIDRAIDSLSAPYPERTIRTVRAAMAATDDPAEQAEGILGVIRSLGLEPYVPPQPLPEITDDDVHLVCWLALT